MGPCCTKEQTRSTNTTTLLDETTVSTSATNSTFGSGAPRHPDVRTTTSVASLAPSEARRSSGWSSSLSGHGFQDAVTPLHGPLNDAFGSSLASEGQRIDSQNCATARAAAAAHNDSAPLGSCSLRGSRCRRARQGMHAHHQFPCTAAAAPSCSNTTTSTLDAIPTADRTATSTSNAPWRRGAYTRIAVPATPSSPPDFASSLLSSPKAEVPQAVQQRQVASNKGVGVGEMASFLVAVHPTSHNSSVACSRTSSPPYCDVTAKPHGGSLPWRNDQ